MTNSPAYQWYPKDILASSRVGEMTAEEECWYRRALDFCWVNGSLPADPEKLARVIGKGCCSNGVQSIIKMFDISADGTRLLHDRQEIEREKQREWREKSAKGGLASKGKRKKARQIGTEQGGTEMVATKRQPNTQPNSNQNNTLQSPVSSLQSSEEKKKTTTTDDEWLDALSEKSVYKRINVRDEFEKAQIWTDANNRQCTRRFFVGWLNRAKPMETNGSNKNNSRYSPKRTDADVIRESEDFYRNYSS